MIAEKQPQSSVISTVQVNLDNVLKQIVHDGLTCYKQTNSKASLPAKVAAAKADKQHKKGAVFAVRAKEHFTAKGVKGYIITSKETLVEDANSLTHFTPNVYRVFQYADSKRQYITGFEEKNLLQVNTFVVDIDTLQFSVQDILLACLDESIGAPTLIVRSDRGYHVYFVLEQPLFISNKNDFRSLTVAKRIAENLKESLASVKADKFCNSFGFFRIPKNENIVWYQPTATYHTGDLITWSMRQDDDKGRSLFVVPSKLTTSSVLQSDWFGDLLRATDIKGEKGQIGRNNALFTVALICYQEGKPIEDAMNLLDEYNSRFTYGLSGDETDKILQSAYSGKYKGAQREYVEALLELYVGDPNKYTISFGNKGWYKHKKERKERVRNHYEEWEEDLIGYITSKFDVAEPFIWLTQKQMCEAIKIPSSSLNVVIKQSTKIITTKVGKGRGSITGWTTVSLFLKHVLLSLQTAKEQYRLYILNTMNELLAECEASPAVALVTTKLAQLAHIYRPDMNKETLDNSS